MAFSVDVRGVDLYIKEITKLDKELGRHLAATGLELAREVAHTARLVAADKGFLPPGRSGRGTGALIAGIDATAKTKNAHGRTMYGAFVENRVERDGRYYPAMYEFGSNPKPGQRRLGKPGTTKLRRSGMQVVGERAFMFPAVDRHREIVRSRFAAAIEAAKRDAGLDI